jgi:OTU domain-containing protein 3
MGKKKDKQKMIEDARMQRKTDRELKIKMRKKMSKADAFKLSNIYLQYYASFDKQLAPLKIKLKDVVGDGNCLFRAFADQVDGSETTHILMREEACKYMVDHQEFFEPFLD